MSTHAPVRAALLGSGIFASTSYLPALPAVPGLQITHLWSRSEASVSALASKAAELALPPATVEFGDAGLDRILADESVQAVIMVLPIGVQPDLIRRCWKAGKHVISEKPVGRDVKQARELVEEWEGMQGVVWRVAESESVVEGREKGRYGGGRERGDEMGGEGCDGESSAALPAPDCLHLACTSACTCRMKERADSVDEERSPAVAGCEDQSSSPGGPYRPAILYTALQCTPSRPSLCQRLTC